MSITRPALTRLAVAGLALPLGGLAALTTASPAGAIEPNVLTIEEDGWITEEAGGTITVSLSEGPSLEDIDFTLTSNLQYSQTEASDWVAVDILASIPAGQTSVEVPLLPADDDLIEGFEQFYVGITSVTGPAVAGEEQTAIISDDERAYLAITLGDEHVDALSVPEGDDGGTVVPVTVHVSTPMANDASVGIGFTFGGCTTTTADDVWVFDGGSVKLPAGAHSGSGSVIVEGDTWDEVDECTEIYVSAYDMWTFHEMGDNSVELTILDDDDTELGDAPDDDTPECDPQVEVCDIQADPGDGGDDPEQPADEPQDGAEVEVKDATASLPRTGSSTVVLGVAGSLLVALGAGLRRTARRLA